MGTHENFLTVQLLERIVKQGDKLEQEDSEGKYSIYAYITQHRMKPTTERDLLIAMSIAYSWMPTMLDLYAEDAEKIEAMLPVVRRLGKIKTLEDFDKNAARIHEDLHLLTERINHSIVGVSKTLHIFFPDTIPIFDRRVLTSWNQLYSGKYKKAPQIKLPKNVPQSRERMVKVYTRYWRLMLCWKQNTGQNSVRRIEKPLYWLGKPKKVPRPLT